MDKDKEALRDWYDKTADRYDTWGEREDEIAVGVAEEEVEGFLELISGIQIRRDTKALDVACGTGRYLIELLKRGAVSSGIDISQKMLSILRKRIDEAGLSKRVEQLVFGDCEELPFPDKEFEIVTCMGLFDYYDLRKAMVFLSEMKRVGTRWVIVDFPNIDDPLVYEFRKNERSVGHEVYIYPPEEIEIALRRAGFRIERKQAVGIEIQYLLRID